jgi:hypothetical protein
MGKKARTSTGIQKAQARKLDKSQLPPPPPPPSEEVRLKIRIFTSLDDDV